MRASTLAAAFALLALAGEARALTCGASFQYKANKPTGWKAIGDAAGPKASANCLAMAKNFLFNSKPAYLAVTKAEICATGTIPVSIFTRLDAKDKREAPDATVSTALGVDCPKPPKKDAAAAKKDG